MSYNDSDFSLSRMQLQIRQDFAAKQMHFAMEKRNLHGVFVLIEFFQEVTDEFHLEAQIEEGKRWLKKLLYSETEKEQQTREGVRARLFLSDEVLNIALHQCNGLFWGASAWAVVYRVLQEDYHEPRSINQFEEDMSELSFDMDKPCKRNSVQAGLYNNGYLREKSIEWPRLRAPKRVIKLRDELKKALERAL